MTLDLDFLQVEEASPEMKLAAFRTFCEKMIKRKESGELTMSEAAYKICGTGFQALEINGVRQEVVSDILNQACDLELPPQHRAESSKWETLVEKVKELPEK